MEIEYSLFIFTNIILFFNLLNSCFVARRFNRLEIRMKALEDSNEIHQTSNTNQSGSQPVQQAVISSYPPITTPVYPQMTYAQPSYYQQSYSGYQAPSAPPYAQPYTQSGPSL